MSRRESPARSHISSRITGAAGIHWAMTVALGVGLGACSSDSGVPDPDTAGSSGLGGTSGAGGSSSSTGGMSVSGTSGAMTGGAMTGGAMTGGATTGGATTGGAGAMTGGAMTGGATTGGAMTGGASGSGGAAPGTCTKGTTTGKQVLFIGESFIAASSIPEETTKLARAAGSLAANDSYVDKSVSGTWIGNGASNSIPSQYRNNSNGVRFVLMNGGGNDCWQGGQASHRTAALDAAEELFGDMGEKGVEKVVYFFYPDPIGAQYASLTACLDLLRPDMKALCEAQTSPKCYWVDLRDTWNGHPEYTSDGIHVANPGNAPTAAAIFESMVENCVAP